MLGQLLHQRYRIDLELGRGGMGAIYRAHDMLLDRPVAVKVLGESGLGTEGRARLLREAQAAARLNHPNLVTVYDAGEAGGTPFIVMELVEGDSLYHRRPDRLEDALDIARQICAALEHAHNHDVVHRDLKPENVLLTPDGLAKLTDFGLAYSKASRATGEGITGTMFYLAPEQARGQPVDGRADLYSLGVMLYELATSALPFQGDNPAAIIAQHLNTPPRPPRELRPDLPASLEAVILRLMAKDPAERFASARETAQALEDVLAGRAPRLVPAVRPALPIPLTSFVGREKELAEVVRRLEPSADAGSPARLLTLIGPGGTGKTRLALHAAAHAAHAFPDGVWLVELASLSDPALVTQTVASTLGVREETGQPLLKTLSDFLRGRGILLILDNCEHLVEASAELAEALLRACPRVHILASSREALGVAGETVFRVPSLPAPDPRLTLPLDELRRFDAVRLFADRAAAVRPGFEITGLNASAVAQICYRLDGVPLAIELAAARVAAMGAEQIAARLDDRFRLLTGGSRTALPRQKTLQALIDWSWDLLDDDEHACLRRLAVFSGGWTLEAAEAVGGMNAGGPPLVPFDLLSRLVDKSLVLAEEQAGQVRYRMLETIRQYAQDRLLEAGEAEAARGRHLRFFTDLAEAAAPQLLAADQLACIQRLEIEHDNLRAALKWALDTAAPEAALRLAGSLYRFWYLCGYWNEGREWLRQALALGSLDEAAPESLARARIGALLGAGWMADEDGSEVPLYSEALALCRRLGDSWGAAFALRGLGAGESDRGNQAEAHTYLADSYALFRTLDEPWGLALVSFNLGWVRLFMEGGRSAYVLWEEGLRLFRKTGDRWGIAVTLASRGYAARMAGDYQGAVSMTEESLQLFNELGDKAGMATSLNRLGNVAFRRGEYAQAAAYLERALAIHRERGDPSGLTTSLNLLAALAYYRGDFTRAEALLQECLDLNAGAEASGDMLATRIYLGWSAYKQGQLERAAALWQQCQERLEHGGDILSTAMVQMCLGMVHFRRGDFEAAAALLEPGLEALREAGDGRYIALALGALGRLRLAQSDAPGAVALFDEALRLMHRLGDRQGVAETLEGLAGALAGLEPERAARLLGAAQALRDKVGAPRPPVEAGDHARTLAALQAALGDGCQAAIQRGKDIEWERL